MTDRPRLSLCMIVRNEEHCIERCIQSVAPYVDEIIVTDTGSTDRTTEIARRLGARVFHFPWTGDFSAAKNHSVERASGDWILFLDADECVAERDIRLIRERTEVSQSSAIALVQRTYLWNSNFVCSIPNPKDYEEGQEFSDCVEVFVFRLFRNDPRIRFVGRVHELIEPVIAELKLDSEKSAVVIHHFGKVGDAAHLEKKKQLYLDLGRRKVEDRPNDAMAHFELGIQLFELQSYAESIPCFEKAYLLNRTYDIALLYIAKAHHLGGKMSEAEKIYRKCLKLAPGNDKVLFEYANFVRDQGQLKKSIQLYTQTLTVNPKHALATFNMGGVHLQLGEIHRGFNLLRQAIRLNPDNETFHEHFGRLALEGDYLEDAAERLQCFVQRFPRSDRVLTTLAGIQFRLKKFDACIQSALNVIQLNPETLAAHETLANAQFCIGKLDEAERSYQKILAITPSHVDALINLAAIAQARGDHRSEATFYRRILEQHSDHAETLRRYSRIAAKIQPLPEAIPILEAAHRTNPTDVGCVIQLGTLYEQCGRIEDARVLFREASKQNLGIRRLATQNAERLSALIKPQAKTHNENKKGN
jgi:tetratricopeptide (TPR) repeat protein